MQAAKPALIRETFPVGPSYECAAGYPVFYHSQDVLSWHQW